MTRAEGKLRKVGLGAIIDKGHIQINSPREIEVYAPSTDRPDLCDWEMTRHWADLVMRVLKWDGTRTTCGRWIVRKPSYQARHNHFVVMLDQLGLGAYDH